MKNIFLTAYNGVKTVFQDKIYAILFLIIFAAMFALFILIPVFAVAGNTVAIQLAIFTLRDYALVALLSGLYALFIAMQIYVIRRRKKTADVGTAVGGGLGALFAGVAGTAFCASCLAPLFALFGIGFGGVLFVLEYRFYFVVGITALMVAAIYLTARKISGMCVSC